MKPVFQTKFAPVGNCLAAVVASLLDLTINEVPNFEVFGEGETWKQVLAIFLYDKGYYIEPDRNIGRHHALHKPFPADYDNVVYIAYGESAKLPHVVIMANGRLVHDPTPKSGGLDTFTHVWVLRHALGPELARNGGRKLHGDLLKLENIEYSTVPQIPFYDEQ